MSWLFLACEDFGLWFDDTFSTYIFVVVVVAILKGSTPIPLFGQDQSKVAQHVVMTLDESFLMSCV